MITCQHNAFYLETDHTSYILRLLSDGTLSHTYYGPRIPAEDLSWAWIVGGIPNNPSFRFTDGVSSQGTLPQECPVFGTGDFRLPALSVQNADGRSVNRLVYHSHRILDTKPHLPGLPQLEADAPTLQITLRDEVGNYNVILSYSVFAAEDVIARHTVIQNTGNTPIFLNRAASMSMDLQRSDLQLLSLYGGSTHERNIRRSELIQGMTSLQSRRGASSHQLNPFAALVQPHTTETQGEVYAAALVYSGDFQITAEVDECGTTRFVAGLNPETFRWKLAPGEEFVTPEALLTYSDAGLEKMSHSYHDVCRRYLGKCADPSVAHPIVLNSWEAMYFQLNEEKLTDMIRRCRGLGIDTFVVDDGWFGHRNSADSSLGDWFVDPDKFPNGLQKVIEVCHENGMKFGLWLEPEMISQDSVLSRAHPDWHIHVPGRDPVLSRDQWVLDMAREDVRDHIFGQLETLLSTYDISYIKWDMNRNITDNGAAWLPADRQGEHSHRYMLGVYDLLERVNRRFPHVFIEGCAAGGGRFDFGILYYCPQIWTSDNSDAIARLKIQTGTSLVYPPSTMAGHVSACPNHQNYRMTPFETRGSVAQMCSFGYELDVGTLCEEERAQIIAQTEKHRQLEPLVNHGSFYRLLSPFESYICAWELVSQDRDHAFLTVVFAQMTPNRRGLRIQLRGLDPDRQYRVIPGDYTASGRVLMNVGIHARPPKKDYGSLTFDLIAE